MGKARRVESWSNIDPKVFEEFYAAVEKLREEMIPRDCDNDSPIEVLIVNRMTHQGIGYFPVPRHEVYSYITHGYLEVHPEKQRELEVATERELSNNVHMAAGALDQYMRIKQHHEYRDQENRRPLNERIREKCVLCQKKVKFDLGHVHDFALTRLLVKYPDYPARYHVENQECKAYDLRRVKFNEMHPEYAGTKPEPRWCMNEKCRCRLPDYSSKKGANDKNVCVNNRCRLDNSKFYPEVADVAS